VVPLSPLGNACAEPIKENRIMEGLVKYQLKAYVDVLNMAANLVERVVLLGAPVPIKGENWEAARKVIPTLHFVFVLRRVSSVFAFFAFIGKHLSNFSALRCFPTITQVVAGRFVNVFSQNDWVLGVAFRAR